jgi:hypothetical protein
MLAFAWVGRIALLWSLVAAGQSWGAPAPAALGPEVEVLDVGTATEVWSQLSVPEGSDPLAAFAAVEALGTSPLSWSLAELFSAREAWLTVTVDNQSAQARSIVLGNDLHLASLRVFPLTEGGALEPTMLDESRLGAMRISPGVGLRLPPGVSRWLVGVNTGSLPTILALRLWAPEVHARRLDIRERVLLGTFGAMCGLWLYNLLLLLSMRLKTFLFFGLGTSGIIATSSIVGGVQYLLPSVLGELSRLWPGWLTLIFLSYNLFYSAYFPEVTNAHRRYVVLWTRLSAVSFAVSFFFPLWPTVIGPFLVLMAVPLGVSLVVFLTFALRFDVRKVINYWSTSMPVIIAGLTVVLEVAGIIPRQPLALEGMLVGVVIHLILVSIILGRLANQESVDKAKLTESIALGRSIQDLLLPPDLAGSLPAAAYEFRYEPCQGLMSGDWIYHWEDRRGVHHFALGDVTGKGPQAALAVAIINTLLQQVAEQGGTAQDAAQFINASLCRNFQGQLTTTLATASVTKGGEVDLINAGGIGWIVYRRGRAVLNLGRASLLGMLATADYRPQRLQLAAGDCLMTFTDGVCSGPRALRRGVLELFPHGAPRKSLAELAELALGWASSGPGGDDRALLVVEIVRQGFTSKAA